MYVHVGSSRVKIAPLTTSARRTRAGRRDKRVAGRHGRLNANTSSCTPHRIENLLFTREKLVAEKLN